MERLTIDGARIITDHRGCKSIMLKATVPERKTTVIYWPQDLRKLICEEVSFELAYQIAYGHPCNEDDYKQAKHLEDVINSALVSSINSENLNLTQAQEILISIGMPTEEFTL